MPLVRVGLLFIWVALSYVTVVAIGNEGLAVASDVFSADLAAGNWNTQFNVDLLSHMVVLGMWVAWRHRWAPLGIAMGLCCIFGGALFSVAYLLILTVHHRGCVEGVLLGAKASLNQQSGNRA